MPVFLHSIQILIVGGGGGAAAAGVGTTCSCVELIVAGGEVMGANSDCLRKWIFKDNYIWEYYLRN